MSVVGPCTLKPMLRPLFRNIFGGPVGSSGVTPTPNCEAVGNEAPGTDWKLWLRCALKRNSLISDGENVRVYVAFPKYALRSVPLGYPPTVAYADAPVHTGV